MVSTIDRKIKISSIDKVRSALQKEQYSLLSLFYKGSKLFFCARCPVGHTWNTYWESFAAGKRCKKCYDVWRKPTIEYIKQQFCDKKYTLLSTEYINSKAKLTYKCPQGHQHEISWNKFKSGHGCPTCAAIEAGNRKRLDIENVRRFIESRHYKMCSELYVDAHQKMKLICPQGHQHEISWNKFKSGHGCPTCAAIEAGNRKRLDSRFVMGSILKEKYQIIENIENRKDSKNKFNIICPKGHQFQTCWNYWQRGHRCPICFHKQSLSEKEIVDLYKCVGLVERDRHLIGPKELDIYFPTQKVAIEYCGLYWHSDQHEQMVPNYHRAKLDACVKQQIRLITIFDDEWKQHKDICVSRINNALSLIKKKIYARKSIVKEIPKAEARKFLSRTHLQGPGICKVAYGLFYNNELVQVMTFGSPARAHTAKGKRVLELKRLASDLDVVVVGGADKLFKLGLQYGKENGYETIKSYCDLRWGTGNLYKKLGFTLTYDSKFTPHYTDGFVRYRNQRLAQNKQITGKTEAESAQQQGLWKIYDCGHQTWEYVIKGK